MCWSLYVQHPQSNNSIAESEKHALHSLTRFLAQLNLDLLDDEDNGRSIQLHGHEDEIVEAYASQAQPNITTVST